jgi:two-component system sensor histidine kinase KdpD
VRGRQFVNRASVLQYGISLLAVGVVTTLIALLNEIEPISNISMLYLLAVIGAGVAFGQREAVVAAVASFIAYDFFFIDPRFTFTVSDPSEWLALGLLLLTGVITGQLAALQRRRALEAEQRERETALLYDISRLLAGVDTQAGLEAVVARLRDELSLSAVRLSLTQERGAPETIIEEGQPEALAAARSAEVAPGSLLLEGAPPTASSRGGAARWIRAVPSKAVMRAVGQMRPALIPIRAGSQRAGTLAVIFGHADGAGTQEETRLLHSVAAQIGAAVQLDRLRDEATEAEALRQADELKTALLNAVSHDLRSPLAAIIASAGSLQQADVTWTDRERTEFAESIENEAQRLNRLVGNLLDLSRIESGSLRPDRGWYDLEALIDEVLGRLKPLLAGRKVLVDVPAELPPVALDYIQIDEVLSNLIENAVKYTPDGSPLEIKVLLDANVVRVSVADRGPGIPAADLPRLFEPFYRVPKTAAKGTGLGLAVAKGLVEAHGGQLLARNRDGGGATFSFSLPIADPEADKEEGTSE